MRLDDGRVIPTFVSQALKAQPITVHGDGMQTRSLCYVSDLVDGVVRMAKSAHPGPINIGNPRETTIIELARSVRDRCVSDSDIVLGPEKAEDPRRRMPDISLASSVLGWEPKTSFEDGLDLAIPWFSSRIAGTAACTDAGAPGAGR
ncbi:GDP-mannose 4,6 dehydratase [Actinocrispum wychmicini]|uniref:GDP-mannose 4,6 dehydratase n=2 Tax=Actinocrispum wychmicini TaxID=1213861 RepID=A0A4R2IL66_9PSEU|nr:GDP-mannose 4,6 dehydratase [Actinocrispum wychmicini]